MKEELQLNHAYEDYGDMTIDQLTELAQTTDVDTIRQDAKNILYFYWGIEIITQ